MVGNISGDDGGDKIFRSVICRGITFGISVIGMAFSFFQYVISRGDKDAVKKAATSLTWSIIAMCIAFFVVILRTILYKLLGFGAEYEEVVPGF